MVAKESEDNKKGTTQAEERRTIPTECTKDDFELNKIKTHPNLSLTNVFCVGSE